MANEILYTGLGDQRLTETLSLAFLLSLADRNFLGNHPALWKAPRLNGTGSLAIKVPHVGLFGYDAMVAPTNEDDSQANVALTDASTVITIARQSFAREVSGTAQITDLGILGPQAFAADLLGAYSARLTNLIAAMPAGFATSVGTSGANMTVADFLAAKAALLAANADDGSPLLTMLHGVQFSDLISELTTTSGGAVQFLQATADLVQTRGGGFKGTFLGCDVFSSNRIPTANAGADRAGGMWTRGAILWSDAVPYIDDPTQQMLLGDAVLMERDRTARSDKTAWVGHAYLGVAEGIDTRGVKIVTDA
jgi:hypothetical protein